MHRHGYKGRKFGRENGERRALLRGLMCSLLQHQRINTTLAKAKEIRRPMEKLITLAKKNTLASRRLVIARLDNLELGSYLVDVLSPQIKRDSGYLRIKTTGFRVGDNAEMAEISFVDEIKPVEKPIATPKPIAKEDKK
ncbi:MAG: 50S ribosomal protein L17 [Candidatus Nomurabacteria bacterium]|jgi:large subunit ribosomal protein L17|nr:50S ribosomal protein L17 [Candidatus Nomurabacteria bacterium]